MATSTSPIYQNIVIAVGRVDRETAFCAETDEQLQTVDIDASMAQLDELTLAAVREDFPGAEVTLSEMGLAVWTDDDAQEFRVDMVWNEVSGLAQHIHERGEWIVYYT